MDDSEPTLPPNPTSSTTSRPPRSSLLTRKRTHDQALYDGEPLTATSSDPALFSDDEQESTGAEDYASKRKKKMYTGSWWSHYVKAGKAEKKKEMKRNYDSGIFMASDSDLPSSDSITSLEEDLLRDEMNTSQARRNFNALSMLGEHLPHTQRLSLQSDHSSPQEPEEDFDPTPRKRLPVGKGINDESSLRLAPAEAYQRHVVLQIIQKCLEGGHESVDLSALSLTDLPPELAELATLTKQTNLVSGMLETGTSLETHLRLFLGNNFLRRLPRPVLDLTNLRELSLRRNKLTTLPSGIRNLVNLVTLNVSGNKLTHLPFEVIELMAFHNLQDLSAEPNLWERPADLTYRNYSRWLRENKHMSLRRADQVSDVSLRGHGESTVPSLTEMSLRQLSRLGPLEDLKQYMPPSTSPEVLGALQVLDDTLQEGGRRCTSCGRDIVRPSKEWIEWWYIITEPKLSNFGEVILMSRAPCVPVKRMKCSHECEGHASDWCDAVQPSKNTEIVLGRE